MSTTHITQYLQTAYSDAHLAALLAHATVEPGEDPARKLSYHSCCCLIGVTNATHALRGYMREFMFGEARPDGCNHHTVLRLGSSLAANAEDEFFCLGKTDAERRDRLVPLIQAEIARREGLRAEFRTQLVIPLCGPDMDVPREVPYVGELEELARK